MSIPRRLIQTGRSSHLKPLAKAAVANFTLLHPDWEYHFFDDNDVALFVSDEFPEYEAVFNAFQYSIQRFDFFRYLAIFRLGGFYFDLDVLLSESIEPLTNDNCVFPFEELTLNRFLRARYGMDWEIGNYAFGAGQENPFLKAVIENCVRAQRDPAWLRPMTKGVPGIFQREFHVFNTTGPGLLSRTLAENPELARQVTVLFPDDVCNSETWHQFGHYGVHLMDGSWRSGGGFIRPRLALWWERWARARLLRQSTRRGPTRSIADARALTSFAGA